MKFDGARESFGSRDRIETANAAMALPILSGLESPKDLKSMSSDELTRLAEEIRVALRNLSEKKSVHFASNMGVVELAIALHAVFDFSKDRLVWDVGHQCYPHKLLTGRFSQFETIRERGGLSGFPNPAESEYDLFKTGHAGCSVGSALGLARGDALMSDFEREEGTEPEERYSVAVVGDGSFSSGPIFEALNHAGGLQQKTLVVLNDNKMSICKRVGGFGRYLDHMRMAPGYLGAKVRVRRALEKLPLAYAFLSRFKDALKAGLVGGALFEDFGFQYVGPIDGHNLPNLIKYLEAFKSASRPVLLHVLTEKGRGYPPAEHDPSKFHSTTPAKILDAQRVEKAREAKKARDRGFRRRLSSVVGIGRPESDDDSTRIEVVSRSIESASFTYWAQKAIYKAMQSDRRVCAIVAAMTQGNMLEKVRSDFPDRFFDVGICEAHAVNFAAGLAKAGMRPIVDIYSGFLQRSYDHLFQEISLQNLPVVFALDRAGFVGSDGPTHHGVFDLSYLRPFPNFSVVAPGDARDMSDAFEFALSRSGPTAIRYPKVETGVISRPFVPFESGKSETIRSGKDGYFAVCGGGILKTALDLAEEIRAGTAEGIEQLDVGVINARFVKPLDADAILQPLRESKPLVVVEENMLAGGFGSAVLEAANDAGLDARPLVRLGIPDRYVEHGTRNEELRDVGLDRAGMISALAEALRRSRLVFDN
ncbi:MAG: 1-deoxy-D-xylulose-5-phosphate synthase [Thermoguttaceae bacterium]|nr:1-deoxy-D-xylulose-5-phosphate synthase [Thermoguttaceae bacterium]